MLGTRWTYGENTQVTGLDVVKKMVPYIEQGLTEYGCDKDQDETETITEEDKDMEEAPMSKTEAMVHFNNLEKQVEKLAM
eukprot:12020440-Heterocapsa_arctica.AAC.1